MTPPPAAPYKPEAPAKGGLRWRFRLVWGRRRRRYLRPRRTDYRGTGGTGGPCLGGGGGSLGTAPAGGGGTGWTAAPPMARPPKPGMTRIPGTAYGRPGKFWLFRRLSLFSLRICDAFFSSVTNSTLPTGTTFSPPT